MGPPVVASVRPLRSSSGYNRKRVRFAPLPEKHHAQHMPTKKRRLNEDREGDAMRNTEQRGVAPRFSSFDTPPSARSISSPDRSGRRASIIEAMKARASQLEQQEEEAEQPKKEGEKEMKLPFSVTPFEPPKQRESIDEFDSADEDENKSTGEANVTPIKSQPPKKTPGRPRKSATVSPKEKVTVSPKEKATVSPKEKEKTKVSPKEKAAVPPKEKTTVSSEEKALESPKEKATVSSEEKTTVSMDEGPSSGKKRAAPRGKSTADKQPKKTPVKARKSATVSPQEKTTVSPSDMATVSPDEGPSSSKKRAAPRGKNAAVKNARAAAAAARKKEQARAAKLRRLKRDLYRRLAKSDDRWNVAARSMIEEEDRYWRTSMEVTPLEQRDWSGEERLFSWPEIHNARRQMGMDVDPAADVDRKDMLHKVSTSVYLVRSVELKKRSETTGLLKVVKSFERARSPPYDWSFEEKETEEALRSTVPAIFVPGGAVRCL